MNIGIIGSEASKFTSETEEKAKDAIFDIVDHHTHPMSHSGLPTIVSGHCHLGGIDIWAEEFADGSAMNKFIFAPKQQMWEPHGYKERNIKIAQASDIVYVITVKELPTSYTGMRFKGCYHCDRRIAGERARGSTALDSPAIETYRNAFDYHDPHIKSGACWTAWYAVEKFGKQARWIII